jgi:hypothetical protein
MAMVRKSALAETVFMAIRVPELPGDADWGLSFGVRASAVQGAPPAMRRTR